jgi:septal ring factor EnvC (AmiA/AmiB activator)
VEEIKEELDSLKLEKANLESLLGILKDVEKAQAELNEINAQIETIKFKLQRIKTKPSLSKSIEKLTQEVNAMKLERDQYEVEQKKLEKKLAQSSNDMQELVEDKKKREDRIRQIAEYYRELVEMGLAGEEFETSESLDQLYNKIKLNQSDRIQLKINKDKLFDKTA